MDGADRPGDEPAPGESTAPRRRRRSGRGRRPATGAGEAVAENGHESDEALASADEEAAPRSEEDEDTAPGAGNQESPPESPITGIEGGSNLPSGVIVAVPRGWARKISAKLVRTVVERALEAEGWTKPSTLEVHLLRDDEIREVNATRRGIDEATDVLSFPMLEMKPGGVVTQDFFVLPPDSPVHLGEVLVSVDRVETQAKEAGHSPERELAYLTVHGVLHILGYDHEIEADRRVMRRREEEVLSSLGIRRDAES